ncbi:hypothetical protein [Pseudoalteromonas mariniglutinosa]|uniref:hypothetical protein n=1 Tax=Pseudoalteromonas mariniglutinosa TaxID=206042 RepID=UPI00384D38F2
MDEQGLAKLYYITLLLYCLSLITVSFSSPSISGSVWGIAALLVGWMQTMLALSIFIQTEEINYLILALPWCGNLFILTNFVLLRKRDNERVCCFLSYAGVICTLAFMFQPKVFLGETSRLIDASIDIGSLLWCMSSVLVLYLFYQLQSRGAFVKLD